MGVKKTKNIHGVTKLAHYNSIPLDITREILLRLPAKSLVRFRCISKLWSSITTQQYFIKSFTTHSSSRPRLLISFKRDEDKMISFSLPQKEITNPHDQVNSYHIKLPENDGYISNFEHVHGLISFHHYLDHIVVWNPSIRQHITLPKPDKLRRGASYLGYDPIENTYKLLCIPHIDDYSPHIFDYGPNILTLGVKESWRMTQECSPMYDFTNDSFKCINGVLYYEVYIPNKACTNNIGLNHMKVVIMSFNVRFEMFKPIGLPCCISDNIESTATHILMDYKGRLALTCSSNTKLWILQNLEKDEWVCNELGVPSIDQIKSFGNLDYLLSDITFDGEFIYVARSWYDDKEINILYHDLKKDNTMTWKFQGYRYREFNIDGYGEERNSIGCLPNHIGMVYMGFWKFTRFSSNHIESIMSLKNISCSSLI